MARGRRTKRKKSKASMRQHRAKFGRVSKQVRKAGFTPGTKAYGREFKKRWRK